MTRYLISLSAALVLVTGTLDGVANAGDIEGTVTFSRGAGHLVVYVAKVHKHFSAPSKHALIDQKGMRFHPHVLPILVGTTVDYLNSDSVRHNVFSPDNEGYNLGTWPKGQRRSYKFKKTGVYTQLCSIHPEMEAFVIVLQNPYYGTTSSSGHFTIHNVPPGHYKLKVWGKKLKSRQKKRKFRVTVTSGKTTTSLAL